MKKRFISGLVLASVLYWSAPIAMAPAAHLDSTIAQSGQRTTQDHSCCPRAAVPTSLVEPAPAALPCGDQHPCCARQAPQNPVSLPVSNGGTRPGAERAAVTVARQDLSLRSANLAEASAHCVFDFYSLRSTVLRI